MSTKTANDKLTELKRAAFLASTKYSAVCRRYQAAAAEAGRLGTEKVAAEAELHRANEMFLKAQEEAKAGNQ